MIQIAIDGACKGNGKTDCIAAGGMVVNHDGVWYTSSVTETASTNQRGEMLALRLALRAVAGASNTDGEAQIITDSEYLFNTITKEWYKGWQSRNWITAAGTPVKNKDLWLDIVYWYEEIKTPVMLYHVKGHLIPDGGATALHIVEEPERLYNYYVGKTSEYLLNNPVKMDKVQGLSLQNNGFKFTDEILTTFVALNGVADRVAVSALLDITNQGGYYE